MAHISTTELAHLRLVYKVLVKPNSSTLENWKSYGYELFGAFSQFLNAFFTGDRDQTLSARSWEAAVVEDKQTWMVIMKAIDFGAICVKKVAILLGYKDAKNWPDNHCEDAFVNGDTEKTYS
jgi:hypothetical protein